ncbi:hypothetical protein KSS87_001550 [Heliosperma pusillum]|nr:hypothetical protein KSS87_001550 [Heliosperma pusillum]
MMINDDIITPGGLLARPYVNGVFKDPSFANIRDMYTCPLEAIHCSDHFQSIYTQLLCGIYKRLDVTKAKTIFSSTLIWAIQFLKTHYPKICRDISSGTLSPKITDTHLRSCMVESYMEPPQPTLAKFVETACIKENWEGILKIIWPNLKYVEAIVTGSMARYIPMLNHYSGGLPLVSAKYVSTECGLGFNLDPMCDPYNTSYTILPNTAYYEFIPLKAGNDELGLQSKLIDMVNVEVGQEYRLGDVLQATWFYNSTPQFKFVRRTNEVLSIDADKTTESELQKVIEMVSNMIQPYNTVIVDYTSNACRKTIPCHYVIYLELKTESEANGFDANVLEKCCLAMEESLGLTYRAGRVSNCIGPIEIRLVSNGTFEKLRDGAISIGVSFGQFKMPRCVTLLPMLELLDSRVVSSYFSPSVPHCHS